MNISQPASLLEDIRGRLHTISEKIASSWRLVDIARDFWGVLHLTFVTWYIPRESCDNQMAKEKGPIVIIVCNVL